ncbi:MAG: PAS domain-containing protein [Chloroflexi bacterium]|nr:PAS domain-containing protein [Chloroflexota bacterium]
MDHSKKNEDQKDETQLDRESLLQGILDHSPAYIYIKDLNGHYILTNRKSEEMFNIKSGDIQGRTPHEVLPREIADVFEDHDNAVIASDTQQEFDEIVIREGLPLNLLTILFPLRRETGESYAICGISTDITRRKQAESAEHEQRILAEAFADTAAILNSTLDLNEVLDRILSNVEKVVPHDAAFILLIDDPQNCARIVRYKGFSEHSQIEALLLICIPVIDLHDTLEIPEWLKLKETDWVQSFVGVPIYFEKQIIGYLCLVSAVSKFFKDSQIERLHAFANQGSIAIRNARLHKQAQELAVLQERQRLAREMHDAVSQSLFSASVIAETLPRIWDRSPEIVKQDLVELQKLTQGALAEMRNLLVELRPQALINADLGDLMHQLVAGLAGRSHINVVADIKGRYFLPADVQIAFYRIAQEALHNVVKHSKASQVVINFENRWDTVSLSIIDNGCGFDLSKVPPDRLGLNIFHERAASIKAVIKINSVPGNGTVINLEWQNLDRQDT